MIDALSTVLVIAIAVVWYVIGHNDGKRRASAWYRKRWLEAVDMNLRDGNRYRAMRAFHLQGAESFDAFADECVAGGVEQVERRGSQDLGGRRRAEEPHRRRIQEHNSIVLTDEDAVRR